MFRKLILVIFILFCFILQCSVFGSLSFAGIIPNLMIVLTASIGFMRGEEAGMAAGFFCGLLSDVFFGDFIGFYALIYLYIGFLNGKFSRIIYPEDIKLPLALITLSDLSLGVVSYVLMFLIRGRLNFSYYVFSIILPEALYTVIVTIFLYPVILWVNRMLDGKGKRSTQKFVR